MDFELEFRRQLIESRCGFTISFAREGLEELKFFVTTLEGFIAREEAREVAEAEVYAHSHGLEAGADFWAENHPYWWEQIFASRLRSAYIVTTMGGKKQGLPRSRRSDPQDQLLGRAALCEHPLSTDGAARKVC